MFILDTDTLRLVHSGHPVVLERQRSVPSHEIASCVVTNAESLRGRLDYLLKASSGEDVVRAFGMLIETQRLLTKLQCVPFDLTAGVEFDRLRAIKSIRKMGRADMLIASIALSRRATVVTRNERDFRLVPGLKVVNWAA